MYAEQIKAAIHKLYLSGQICRPIAVQSAKTIHMFGSERDDLGNPTLIPNDKQLTIIWENSSYYFSIDFSLNSEPDCYAENLKFGHSHSSSLSQSYEEILNHLHHIQKAS